MREIEGTRTEKNLNEAFAGECQARVKYEYYASQARKDGYEQIAEIFLESSGNEREHAKLWFKQLHGGKVPETLANLKDAAGGENYEHEDMYVRMAREAREEGFEEIAKMFEGVGDIEAQHEERYRKLVENIEEGMVFKGDGVTVWRCRNCGYIHIGEEAPEMCPICAHPRGFFEIAAQNY
ncbi:MAG: rubrerythrin family protein [Candidatus Nomurabacteria bacterium]|jgi:rubrerythrin|nr:rubrerythrin family protein [Candidatus Nomurabacteria bacterium]